MILDQFPALRALSEAEQLQLAEELYDTVLGKLPQLSDNEIHAELEKSMTEFRANPDSACDWKSLKARVLARRNT